MSFRDQRRRVSPMEAPEQFFAQQSSHQDGGRGMRGLLLGALALLLVVGGVATACSGTQIRSGQVGVRVVDIGGNAGVQERELGVGWYFPQWGSYVLKFPTTVRTEVWADNEVRSGEQIGPALSFRNRDGVATRVAVSMQVRMDPEHASVAVQMYRLGFEDLIRGPVQRDLQDAFVRLGPHYSSADLVTNGGAPLLAEVAVQLRERLAPQGIVIQDITMVGAPALPEQIMNRINARIEAEQNAATQEQQVRVVEAQARQRIAEAEGLARATEIEGAALARNPSVLRMREIEQWNGMCPLDTDICGAAALVDAQ